jgi:cation:H+ antiporter
VPVQPASFVDIVVNILAGFLLFVFIFTGKGRNLEKWEGMVFLAMYVGYLVFLIFNG